MSVKSEELTILEGLYEEAKAFVEENYKSAPGDLRDKNIKILATMNQLIELKKLKR